MIKKTYADVLCFEITPKMDATTVLLLVMQMLLLYVDGKLLWKDIYYFMCHF